MLSDIKGFNRKKTLEILLLVLGFLFPRTIILDLRRLLFRIRKGQNSRETTFLTNNAIRKSKKSEISKKDP